MTEPKRNEDKEYLEVLGHIRWNEITFTCKCGEVHKFTAVNHKIMELKKENERLKILLKDSASLLEVLSDISGWYCGGEASRQVDELLEKINQEANDFTKKIAGV